MDLSLYSQAFLQWRRHIMLTFLVRYYPQYDWVTIRGQNSVPNPTSSTLSATHSSGRILDVASTRIRSPSELWSGSQVQCAFGTFISFLLYCGVFSKTRVKQSTESYDKMGPVGVDERWEAFGPFHDYLIQAFPLMYVTHL